jgi:hypothetical protein
MKHKRHKTESNIRKRGLNLQGNENPEIFIVPNLEKVV